METPTEPPPETQTDGPDPPSGDGHDLLRAELDSLRHSHQSLLCQSSAMEERCNQLQQHNAGLVKSVGELSGERDSLSEEIHKLRNGFASRIDEELETKLELEIEVQILKGAIERLELDRNNRDGFLLKCLDLIRSAKEGLIRVIGADNDIETRAEEAELGQELGQESSAILEEIRVISKLAASAEVKVNEYNELRREKKQLESSVVSLTEENRDISSLLRVALVEKEAAEKRLKGGSEQKRVAILQRVGFGFGFMMGGGGNEQSAENSGASVTGSKSDGSESEEEVISLASTVEKIMKNLRLEITQLRRSLEESRSDTERLQSLAEQQAQQIADNKQYIRELENRERVLTQNVEGLMVEMKESEADVARWREACELEVEAGKNEIGEREKVIAILKQELEKTKAALEISNGKLALKEELAATAMAAQAAAERSLELADSRAAGLRVQIEELSRQVEEAESRERNNRRVRHICWPWRPLKINPANHSQNRLDVRRFLPEMQALLHYNG